MTPGEAMRMVILNNSRKMPLKSDVDDIFTNAGQLWQGNDEGNKFIKTIIEYNG
jgi:hypothetical protein